MESPVAVSVSGQKRPLSALVVIHTGDGQILLLERSRQPGFWQSVTGSLEADESFSAAAVRELAEETGIRCRESDLKDTGVENQFEILPLWRDRYPPGVTRNIERVFLFEAAPDTPVKLAPDEHRDAAWLPWQQAVEKVFSWTNADAILRLALIRGWVAPRN